MFGRIVHAILVAILLVVIVIAFGKAFYSADLPGRTLPAFLATLAVGAATFSALGLALTGFVPNAEAAPAVVNFTILPLLFLSDIFIPIQNPNAWYVKLAKVFPVYHFSQAMKTAYFSPAGTGWRATDLLIMRARGQGRMEDAGLGHHHVGSLERPVGHQRGLDDRHTGASPGPGLHAGLLLHAGGTGREQGEHFLLAAVRPRWEEDRGVRRLHVP